MPQFSIVIPTYNRAKFLPRAIESALDQSLPDVEVIVSDNASTDGTAEVVQAFGDRVRYHRHEKNIGMWANIAQAPELVRSEYFSWLQDDDLVRRDFAARAHQGLSAADDVVMYLGWNAYSSSPTSLRKWTSLHGPLIPVNWLSSEIEHVDGLMLVPFCFFDSQGIPPALAMRTQAARGLARDLLPDCVFFNEYILLQAVAAQGRVAIDPWIGAIHIDHSEQANRTTPNGPLEILRQRQAHAEYTQTLMAGLPDRWKALFRESLEKLPIETRSHLVRNAIPKMHKEFWSSAPPIVVEMKDIVLETLPEHVREEIRKLLGEKARLSPLSPRDLVRKVIPYRYIRAIRVARQSLNRDGD